MSRYLPLLSKISAYGTGSMSAAAAALAAILGFSEPATADVLKTKIRVSSPGLESRVDEETLQHGVVQNGPQQGTYRVDANITLKNSGAAFPGPLQLFYSLCFAEPETGWSACADGKYQKLESGIPVGGRLNYAAVFKLRGGRNTLRVPRGNGYAEVPINNLQPEITVRVERGATEIYKADHLLPPVQDYECRKFCP